MLGKQKEKAFERKGMNTLAESQKRENHNAVMQQWPRGSLSGVSVQKPKSFSTALVCLEPSRYPSSPSQNIIQTTPWTTVNFLSSSGM